MQALLVLLVACAQPPTLPSLSGDATIVAFGDSLTAGSGAPAEAAYPARLADLTQRRVINAGVPGETTAEGRQRLPGVIERHRPDLVLLCLGGNDFLRDQPEARTRENLSAMLALLQQRGIPTVLIAVPQRSLLGGPHPMYEALAGEYGVPLLTGTMNRVLRHPDLKSDRIHPNAEGYALIATAIRDLLAARGAL